MLAARWHGRGDVRVEDIPDLRDPGPGEVRLRIEACGICGTDVEEYESGPAIIAIEPHPLTGTCAPLTLGHEAVGVVESIGAGVELAPGTRVAVETNMHCGRCWWCRRGDFQLCEILGSLGLMGDGGLAEAMLAPAYMCVPYGDHVPAEHAALSEPLSVAVRAVRRGGVSVDTNVAILGAGTIGLLLAQVARLAGARSVVVSEQIPERRALAVELGADAAVAPEEIADAVAASTRGIGPDVVFEAAGTSAAAVEAVRLTRRGGTAVLMGVFDADVPLPMLDVLLSEKSVIASLSHVVDGDFTTAVELIERGRVQVAPLVSDLIPLTGLVELGLKPLVSEPQAHLKIVVTPAVRG